MNSLSKVALLVTLFTVPFAGFAMDFSDMPALESDVVVTTATNVTEVAQEAGNKVVEFVKENPVATGLVAAGLVTALGLYKWIRGSKAAEAKVENTPVEVKKSTALFSNKATIPTVAENPAKAPEVKTSEVKTETAPVQKKSTALFPNKANVNKK